MMHQKKQNEIKNKFTDVVLPNGEILRSEKTIILTEPHESP